MTVTGEYRPGLVVVRGAGDIATGAIQKLAHAGFAVVALEVPHPMAIRWKAALCPAIHEGRWTVEDLTGIRVDTADQALELFEAWDEATFPVAILADPEARSLATLRPIALVDALLAKRNCGTHVGMAPVTVGCGPGFTAGEDVHLVVETMRGHFLGRVLLTGSALPNTGVPGLIAGRAAERVLHSPVAGTVEVLRGIGDVVEEGEPICAITGPQGRTEVSATIRGVIRGMIPDGFEVPERFKIADVDPRLEMVDCCDTISDKSRAVGGAALDAVLLGLTRQGLWGPGRGRDVAAAAAGA